MYSAVQVFYKVSINYDHYVSFKNPDGTLGYKLVPVKKQTTP